MNSNKDLNKPQPLCSIQKITDYKRLSYTRISSGILNDTRLSPTALGLLVYALSRPPDWQLYPKQLMKRFHVRARTIRKALKELAVAGYACLTVRWQGGYGKTFGSHWLIRESPELPWPEGVKIRDDVFRHLEKPSLLITIYPQ